MMNDNHYNYLRWSPCWSSTPVLIVVVVEEQVISFIIVIVSCQCLRCHYNTETITVGVVIDL